MGINSPRYLPPGKLVYIRQETETDERVFENELLCCHFLERLCIATNRFDFAVHDYALTPFGAHLIIFPRKDNVDQIARALFTSAAKKFSNFKCRKASGRVFKNPFSSRPLDSKEDLARCKEDIIAAVITQTGATLDRWPYICLNAAGDRFNICRPILTHTADNPPRRNWDGPPYYYKNGYPTIHWYLRVLEMIVKD
jgi:hypothetical protein